MKSKLMLVVFAVCFSLFLFLGYRASQAVFSGEGPPDSTSQAAAGPVLLEEEPAESIPAEPFTLIILVDDLFAPEPVLDGVWLSRSTDAGRGSLFFPIFPSQAEDGDRRDLNLRGAFWLGDSGLPSQQFQTILRDRNLSWHQVILLDRIALGEIGSILAAINIEYRQLNAVGLASLGYTVENRQLVQTNQALFINELCGQLPLPPQSELLQRFLAGFTGHLVVIQTTPDAISQAWSTVSYCLFPTLTLANP